MIVETATIYTFSALLLMVIIMAFYFAIFFMIFYIAGWALAVPIRAIAKLLNI